MPSLFEDIFNSHRGSLHVLIPAMIKKKIDVKEY
jgi:hypothetical protein